MQQLRIYKLFSLPQRPIPNALLFILDKATQKVEMYITSRTGEPTSVGETDLSGIESLYSSDGSIQVQGSDNINLKLSQSLKALIESALQDGDPVEDPLSRQSIETHKNDLSNPHQVTSEQLPTGQNLILIFNNALL